MAELSELEHFGRALRLRRSREQQRSAFDLPPLRLGTVRMPLNAEDDLLEEMLNDTRD